MAYSVVDFVADQLRAAAPRAEWNASNENRAAELASIFVRAGIRDLSKLKVAKDLFEFDIQTNEVGTVSVGESGLVLRYEGQSFGYLGTPFKSDNGVSRQYAIDVNDYGSQENRVYSIVVNVPMLDGLLVAWSPHGHGNVAYILTNSGNGVAIIPRWQSSSDMAAIRQGALMIGAFAVSFVLPAAGINVAQSIGAAVMGPSLAAAYPAIAGAIGGAALGAAFNGGDIEQAAKMAIIGAAAGVAANAVGNLAASATDLEVVGKLTAAATRAALTGRDIETAVAYTALTQAGQIYDAFSGNVAPVDQAPEFNAAESEAPPQVAPLPIPEIVIADNGDSEMPMPIYPEEQSMPDNFFTFDYGFEPSGANFFGPEEFLPEYQYTLPQTAMIDIPVIGSEGIPAISVAENFQPMPTVAVSDFISPETQAISTAVLPVEAPISASDPWSFDTTKNLIQVVSQGALATLQIMAGYNQIKRDAPVNVSARTYNPATGQTRVALDSGVIETRDAAGNVVKVAPPKGQPQTTATGNIVVNNGDGTYTLISPDGAQRRIQYAPGISTAGGGGFNLSEIPTPYILGAVGLAALVFLRRR